MITISIDGKEVKIPAGSTVLEAARKANIEIPTLCDHPNLKPYGNCRLCVVEVKNMQSLQTSCTLQVSEGIEVFTDNERIRKARQYALALIFSERNHFCPYCQVTGGDCDLQNHAYDLGMTHWPLMPEWNKYLLDASHEFIVFEHNRCILCRQCVRACAELIGNFTLGVKERGSDCSIIADLDVPLGNSSCISCGTCLQVCPTGALIDRWSAYQGKEMEVDVTKTICVGCSIGCGIDVMVRDNRLIRIEGDWDAEQNSGVICDIGRFYPMVEDRERVLNPMVRKNGELKAATWEEALADIKENLQPLLENEKDSVEAVISTRLPIESMNYFKQIFKDNYQIESVTSTEGEQFGADSLDLAKFNDLDKADCYLVIGEDITKNHQVASFLVKRRIPAGAKLVTINSKEDGLDLFAHYTLKVKEEKITPFLNAISDAIRLDKEVDLGNIRLDRESVNDALTTLKTAKNTIIIAGNDVSLEGTDYIKLITELSKSLNAKVITLRGGANSLAAFLLGLSGDFAVNNLKGAYIALGDEKLSQTVMNKLENIPYLVIQSSYVSPITAAASVILPVHNWLEQNGHYLSMDGNLQKAKAALNSSEGARCNNQTLKLIAETLGIEVNDNWKNLLN